jgi:hypothetical protein
MQEDKSDAWWLSEETGPYDDPEDFPLSDRCLLSFGSSAGPPALPVMYNNFKRIIQNEDTIVILNEMSHDARVIRMNGEHLPSHMRFWMGDSVGHWEGDTLVIDTTNFKEKPALFNASKDLHVVERISRIDENTLRYEFMVDDSAWTQPWGGEYPWPATDDKIYEYACHEGNYALGGMLRGARRLEQDAMEAQSVSQ